MKFLLAAVNAKYIHSNPALYSLKSYAGEEWRDSIEIVEYTINNRPADILADIYKRRPDAAAFSCYIWNREVILETVVELRKLLPALPVWLGGPEVTFDARDVLRRYPMVTGIMAGEGEATFLDLLRYYAGRTGSGPADAPQKLKDIPGLVLPGGATALRPLTELSRLPFLYDSLTPFENRIIYYESARGCPYRCSYCLSAVDKTVRLRDLGTVEKELQYFLDNRVPQVKFVDRTFNCNHGHAMTVWQYIQEHDNGVTNFHFEVAGDILREDEISLLRKMRPGLVQLEIGVQSFNPDTLREICRVTDLEKLERNVAALRGGNNIHLHLDLIAGLPYEDYESFGRSFDRVYAMRPEQLQLGFLKVLKGSPMHGKAEAYGITCLSRPPYEVLYTRWLPYEKVLALKKVEEMVELYYNSGQFTCTLPALEAVFPSPFALYESLAGYYERQGYFTRSPARSHRFEILFRFAAEQDPDAEGLYRELLTYDMYLRENLKSRPAFAADPALWKKEARALDAAGDGDRRMTHLERFSYPVWREGAARGAQEGGPWLVRFDYRRRNPWSREAETAVFDACGRLDGAKRDTR